MLITLESHELRTTAERARQAFIKAQRLVDAVWLRITGELVYPTPEDTYTVFLEDGHWVVGFFDPSLEDQTEVSSTDDRNDFANLYTEQIYDCD
jgi:hypothetical protein